jgi:SAM-dependent methyltransferase
VVTTPGFDETPGFDKEYWESHWQEASGTASGREIGPNPYLARELGHLAAGTALDAGCGEGAEAIWLSSAGWHVTAADISTEALARAMARATSVGVAPERVEWVEADLSVWSPAQQFDLVTTHYAHPAMAQLAFYERLAGWVAASGTLLIVGHRHTAATPEHGHQGHGHGDDGHGHPHGPPEEASVTAASITSRLDPSRWDVVTADEPVRILTDATGRTVQLDDVVVRATRRP